MNIYALGVVLYELITGIKPFAADTPMAVMMKHITEPLPNPKLFVPGLPDTVVQVLEKALAKDPDDRYADMAAFFEALERLYSARSETSQVDHPTQVRSQAAQSGIPLSGHAPRHDQRLSQPVPPSARKAPKGFPTWAVVLIALGGLASVGIAAVILAGALLLGGGSPTATLHMISLVSSTQAVVVSVSSTPTQEPSPLPTETSAPRPIVTPAGTTDTELLLYEDDFSDSGSGWEVLNSDVASVGYKEGVYFVRTLQENIVMWGASRQVFIDTGIEVDTTQITAPANNINDHGVMCRLQPNGDDYSFSISGDGFFSIQKAKDDA